MSWKVLRLGRLGRVASDYRGSEGRRRGVCGKTRRLVTSLAKVRIFWKYLKDRRSGCRLNISWRVFSVNPFSSRF
jgi:hypothetical protein